MVAEPLPSTEEEYFGELVEEYKAGWDTGYKAGYKDGYDHALTVLANRLGVAHD